MGKGPQFHRSCKVSLTLHLVEQGAAVAAQPSVLATGLRHALAGVLPAKQLEIGAASDAAKSRLHHETQKEVITTCTHPGAGTEAGTLGSRTSCWGAVSQTVPELIGGARRGDLNLSCSEVLLLEYCNFCAAQEEDERALWHYSRGLSAATIKIKLIRMRFRG